jgi:uncharacterized protein (TIGR02599 family)
MTILIILVGIISSIGNLVMNTVTRTSSKIDAFASARAGFDILNQKLTQATLNTYWEYDNPLNPSLYRRASDLQFVVRQNVQNSAYGQEVYFPSPEAYSKQSGVQSVDGLLNACGFFVEYGSNASFRPTALSRASKLRYRYRLMQGFQPTENLSIYSRPYSSSSNGWITDVCNYPPPASSGTSVTPLADNVIALIVWPRLSSADDSTGAKLAPNYQYDSMEGAKLTPQPITANQLPPTVQVSMVIISEAAASRIDTNSDTPPAIIEEALKGKFTDVRQYKADLDTLSTALSAKHIDFQVFNTTVPMRESKWSDASQ